MLSGSKVYGEGADFGSVPDFSPQKRMKFVDSFVRFCAHGTLPLPQSEGTWTVFAAAEADGRIRGTASGTSASPQRTASATRSLRRVTMPVPYVSESLF